jgi:molybdopterin/thiamine biosynthesis adenylyltransferase
MKTTYVAALIAIGAAGCQTTELRPNANWGRTDVYERSTLQGRTISVENFYNLNESCRSIGVPSLRIASQPLAGRIYARNEMSNPSYTRSNPRFKCNSRSAPTLGVYYTPAPGFVGRDTMDIEVFWTDGDVWRYKVNIDVR